MENEGERRRGRKKEEKKRVNVYLIILDREEYKPLWVRHEDGFIISSFWNFFHG